MNVSTRLGARRITAQDATFVSEINVTKAETAHGGSPRTMEKLLMIWRHWLKWLTTPLLTAPNLRPLYVASFLVSMPLGILTLLLTVYARDLGLSMSAIGLVLGSFFLTRCKMF